MSQPVKYVTFIVEESGLSPGRNIGHQDKDIP